MDMRSNQDSSYDEPANEANNNSNLDQLTIDTIRTHLCLMEVGFNPLTIDESQIRQLYEEAINDPRKKEILLQKLIRKESNVNPEEGNNPTFINNKRPREEGDEDLNEIKGRRSSNVGSPFNGKFMSEMKDSSTLRGGNSANSNNKLLLSNPSIVNASGRRSPVPNSVFQEEFKSEMRDSSNIIVHSASPKLTRLDVINSINNTSLSDTNLNVASSATSKNEVMNYQEIAIDLLILSSFTAALTGMVYCSSGYLQEVNFAYLPALDSKVLTLTLLLFGAVAVIAYLYQKHKAALIRGNKLIADNCFQEVKNRLLEKPTESILAENFIQTYCETNNTKAERFREDILPFFKLQMKDDAQVEETNMMYDGSSQVVWKLK